MIYIKTELSSGVELKVDVYGDEFYSLCPDCGKETPVEEESLANIFEKGVCGTSVCCPECTNKRLNK